VIRGADLSTSMSDYLVRVLDATDAITVRPHLEIVGGGGGEAFDHVVVRDRRTGTTERVATDAVFVLIGARPFTDWLGSDVLRDDWGSIVTDGDLPDGTHGDRPPLARETSVPGVFAVGDVRRNAVKRVASAVGEGAIVVPSVHRYLTEPVAQADAGDLRARTRSTTA
jgi:thioredoxin reductase (NADPH)